MKVLNLILFAMGVTVAAVIAGPSAALLCAVFLMGALLMQINGERQARFCVTLTVSEILDDVLQAFKTRLPSLNYFAHDFSSDRVKYGQTIIAHLPTVPSVLDHTTSYHTSAQNARDLLTDVSIVMNQWKDVRITMTHADLSQDRNQNYLKTIGNAGYALAKAVVDHCLSKVLVANFTNYTTQSIATTSKETLNDICEGLNLVNAGVPRFGICTPAFMSALDEDARISSGDYYGQRSGADPFRRLTNLCGFQEIQEYPAFPTNSESLSAFFFDERAIGLATRLPEDPTEIAQQLGIPMTYSHHVVEDAETGLAISAFGDIDQVSHNIFLAFSVMFGAVAGSQAGAAGALTDYAGWRVRTS